MLPITEPLKVRTVMVKCIAEKGKPSYYADGIVQEIGDRSRFPVAEAERLVAAGKATIIPDSEKVESLGFAPADPPSAKHWNASNW
jgi:hypothetical protein